MFPPGIRFIVQTLPWLLIYPLALSLTFYVVTTLVDLDISLPRWAQVLILVISPFATLPLQNIWSSLRKRREAHALDAVPTPVINGVLPGNFDVIWKLANNKIGYPSE